MSLAIRPEITSSFRDDDEEQAAAAVPLLAAAAAAPTRSRSHAGDVHILSAAFLFVFSAYLPTQNLQSTLNNDGNLGAVSMGIVYVSFTVFAATAAAVVRGLGSRRALVLGTSGYALFILANLHPTWYTMVPALVYLGFTSSIMWVGQGTYLTSAAFSHATENKLNDDQVLGRFNGEFWGMFASTQVIGNLISLVVLRNDKDGGGAEEKNLLFTVFLGCMVVGIVLMCLLSSRDENSLNRGVGDHELSEHSILWDMSKSAVAPLADRRMLLLAPLLAYYGLQKAFVWAVFTKSIVTPVLGVAGVGGAMALYGTAGVISSRTGGRPSDHRPLLVDAYRVGRSRPAGRSAALATLFLQSHWWRSRVSGPAARRRRVGRRRRHPKHAAECVDRAPLQRQGGGVRAREDVAGGRDGGGVLPEPRRHAAGHARRGGRCARRCSHRVPVPVSRRRGVVRPETLTRARTRAGTAPRFCDSSDVSSLRLVWPYTVRKHRGGVIGGCYR